MFWETKLIYAVEKAPNMKWKNHKSAISIFNSITIELSKHMGYKHVQLDDITLAVIHYKDAHYKREEDFWTKIPDDFITEWKW
jgi:hemerythrin